MQSRRSCQSCRGWGGGSGSHACAPSHATLHCLIQLLLRIAHMHTGDSFPLPPTHRWSTMLHPNATCKAILPPPWRAHVGAHALPPTLAPPSLPGSRRRQTGRQAGAKRVRPKAWDPWSAPLGCRSNCCCRCWLRRAAAASAAAVPVLLHGPPAVRGQGRAAAAAAAGRGRSASLQGCVCQHGRAQRWSKARRPRCGMHARPWRTCALLPPLAARARTCVYICMPAGVGKPLGACAEEWVWQTEQEGDGIEQERIGLSLRWPCCPRRPVPHARLWLGARQR